MKSTKSHEGELSRSLHIVFGKSIDRKRVKTLNFFALPTAKNLLCRITANITILDNNVKAFLSIFIAKIFLNSMRLIFIFYCTTKFNFINALRFQSDCSNLTFYLIFLSLWITLISITQALHFHCCRLLQFLTPRSR